MEIQVIRGRRLYARNPSNSSFDHLTETGGNEPATISIEPSRFKAYKLENEFIAFGPIPTYDGP